MLHHQQQPELYGCLYHALYALTGDPDVLEHVDDLSNARFYARLHGWGLMVITPWADYSDPAATTPCRFWEAVTSEHPQPYLLTVATERLPGFRHAVAALVSTRSVSISDSRHACPFTLTFREFLDSEYAQAFLVEQLLPAELDAYPHEDAHFSVVQALARDRIDPHPDLTL